MPHVFEHAPSGRSKCRGCGQAIAKDDLRFGESVENPYGEGDRILWFHPTCAALKRPEPFLEAVEHGAPEIDGLDDLRSEASLGLSHRRLPRIDGAERSPTGRARCRSCRELIEKDAWRIRLVWWEEARFSPSGFIHAQCAREFFETDQVHARVAHFSSGLGDDDVAEVEQLAKDGTAS